ncbi:NAD-dependent epimerase/dehydratase family protein [Siccirubricoccus phaeus]|uniref:NAD-dependent epimerase/dehydratase family protein n=1 Tax=Siccirubricoccus phaeus TaxID=2595053 RepID=UPI0011F208AF|nr:NAD(P)-dependent oxidoreductase [Siccirubricoccus phaeus]
MDTILVTGGAGYLGGALSQKLLRSGYQVRVLDCLRFGGQALLPLLAEPGFRFIPGDVRDPEAVARALDGADAVVHLAAVVGDPNCAAEPELAREVNEAASLALLRAVGDRRMVFASTCSNYGRMADTSVLATEEHELRPVSLYAETKVAVERALLEAGHTVLRFATLYGLAARTRFDLTVNQFAAEMQVLGKLTVFGEQFWRPYVHVQDAAAGIALALSSPREKVAGEVFNVGATAENFRKQDIVEMVQQRLRKKAEVIRVARAEDPRDYRVSFEKIAARLGFRPERSVAQGIDEVVSAFETGIFRPTEITA